MSAAEIFILLDAFNLYYLKIGIIRTVNASKIKLKRVVGLEEFCSDISEEFIINALQLL